MLVSAQVVISCCVYEIPKQLRQDNNQICLTIGHLLLQKSSMHMSFQTNAHTQKVDPGF